MNDRGSQHALYGLQERHPRTTKILALLFFLAGLALFIRVM